MTPTQKILLTVGVALIAAAFLLPIITKLGLGRLPGDIRIEREGFSFYAPITTMILISVIVTIVMRFLNR